MAEQGTTETCSTISPTSTNRGEQVRCGAGGAGGEQAESAAQEAEGCEVALDIVQVVANRGVKGSLTGISVGAVTPIDKVWHSLQAFGDIDFVYSYSVILIEIQDIIRAPPPSEANVMRHATIVCVATTTLFYMLCGCMGYAAFGDDAPGNLLTGFGCYEPFWLLDVANAAIVIYLVGA